MNQEAVAGIILCVMGLALLLIPPNTWWRVAEMENRGRERAH